MSVIFNFSNAHNLPIFQPILMILVSKFIVHRVLSDKTYLSLELLSPLIENLRILVMLFDSLDVYLPHTVIFCHGPSTDSRICVGS